MWGRYIAIGVGCVTVALAVYGFSFDVRFWLEEHGWRRSERKAIERLRALAEPARSDLDRFAELCGWFEGQAAEIAQLPEVEPWRRWLPPEVSR